MKVVLVNTQIGGGANVACKRLTVALQKTGVDAALIEIKSTKWHWLWERLCIFVANRLSRQNLFSVSIANTGTDISKCKEVQEADIIHLHWINQGGLSLHNIEQLQSLGKPIVWTCHDMWPFTGICHHAYGCRNFEHNCGNCRFLKSRSNADLSYKLMNKKKSRYSSDLHFVTVSSWLESLAQKSPLVQHVTTIPNTLDVATFNIQDKQQARAYYNLPQDKKIILMGANKLNDPIKGFEYLREALTSIHNTDNVCLCLFGKVKNDANFLASLPVQTILISKSFTPDDLARLYAAADVTIVPSLYETFGQTLSESLACGRPVVSFDNSGQTDIVVHLKNGYLAEWKNSEDLAKGIDYVLSTHFDELMLRSCAVEHFSESVVAQQYIQLYNSLLK